MILLLVWGCYQHQTNNQSEKTIDEAEIIALKCIKKLPVRYRTNVYAAYFFTTLRQNVVILHCVVDNQYAKGFGCPDKIIDNESYGLLMYNHYQKSFTDCAFKKQFRKLVKRFKLEDDISDGKDLVFMFDVTDGTPKLYNTNNKYIMTAFRYGEDALYRKKK